MNEATWAAPRRGRTAGLRFVADSGLTRRATAGDAAAFAEIYRRYNRELGRYCQAITGSRELSEDALQNTIVSAIKSLPGETREIALKPWLYRVAYNESISLLRQRRPAAELDPDLTEPGSDPAVRSERREHLRSLLRDLEALPERQRGALVMRELSDLSHAEIAATFEFSEGAARQAIYEARGALLEMAEGREMECAAVRSEISESDKRMLRGRRLRAHLRECDGCREFEAAIGRRRAEFAQIAPLAPVAAAGILQSVLGSGGGGLTALGGAAGGSAAVKSAAAVVAVVAAGVGTADLTGVVDLDGAGPRAGIAERDGAGDAARAQPHQGGPGAPAGEAHGQASGTGTGSQDGDGGSGKPGKGSGRGQRNANGHGQGQGQGNGHANGGGQGNGVGTAGTPPGQAQTPPGQVQTPPGQAGSSASTQNPNGTPPGQAQTPPGQELDPPGSVLIPPGDAHSNGSQAGGVGGVGLGPLGAGPPGKPSE